MKKEEYLSVSWVESIASWSDECFNDDLYRYDYNISFVYKFIYFQAGQIHAHHVHVWMAVNVVNRDTVTNVHVDQDTGAIIVKMLNVNIFNLIESKMCIHFFNINKDIFY